MHECTHTLSNALWNVRKKLTRYKTDKVCVTKSSLKIRQRPFCIPTRTSFWIFVLLTPIEENQQLLNQFANPVAIVTHVDSWHVVIQTDRCPHQERYPVSVRQVITHSFFLWRFHSITQGKHDSRRWSTCTCTCLLVTSPAPWKTGSCGWGTCLCMTSLTPPTFDSCR